MADEKDKQANDVKRQNGRFAPGVSGNPGGRPGRPSTHREITALAQTMSPSALNRLHEIYMDPKTPPLAAVAAAREVLDRAHGRAAQPQVHFDGSSDADIDGTGLTALLQRARLSQQSKREKVISDADFVVSPNGHADKPEPKAPPPPPEPEPEEVTEPEPEPEPVILKRAPDPKPKTAPKPANDARGRPAPDFVRVPGTNTVRRVP